MGNPIPIQERSVDPYSSYDSNVVNKLTRMLSDGNNVLLLPSPISCSMLTDSTLVANRGKAIKDDVLIEIENIIIDMADKDFYVDSSNGVWNEDGIYYIVLCYTYQKTSPPPSVSIKIIKPSQRTTVYNTALHLFINAIYVVNNVIIGIYGSDPDDINNRRVYAGNESSVNFRTVSNGGPSDITSNDDNIAVDSSPGDTIIYLPLVSSLSKIIRIMKISPDTNIVTIYRKDTDTIEGVTMITLKKIYDAVTLIPYQGTKTWIQL